MLIYVKYKEIFSMSNDPSKNIPEFTLSWALAFLLTGAGAFFLMGKALNAIKSEASAVSDWSGDTVLLTGAAIASLFAMIALLFSTFVRAKRL